MDNNPFWNKLTKALRDSKIDNELKNLTLNDSFFKDTDFNFAQRHVIRDKFFELFPNWIINYFTGLENFTEKNITNGNTDAINLVFLGNNYSKIYTLPNEYIYYSHLSKSLSIPQIQFDLTSLDKLNTDGIVCISVPSSNNGEIESKQLVIDYCQKNNIPIFIDVAYCGLTVPGTIKIGKSSKTFFAFSFSKTLGLAFNRVGILYSNKDIISASLLNKLGYVNLSGASAALHLMQKIPCDYVYQTYKDQYQDICKDANLKTTNCILFGHTAKGEKYCITEMYNLK
jgi:hypothetical protein